MTFHQPRRAPDGRALLNLGCGARTHPDWTNVDFSPYARLAGWPRLSSLATRIGLISAERYRLLRAVDPAIIHHDLRRGVPFRDAGFDAVYHSHFLEHLDRDAGRRLLVECHRVLKPGGVLRVVVPDLHRLSSAYLESFAAMDRDGTKGEALDRHHDATEALIGQMVRRDYTGRADQHPVLRRAERLIRGDAARAGELHRWMYDRHSLGELLARVGFHEVREEAADTSRIRGWAGFALDTEPDGSVYKPESLFMEAVAPDESAD